MFLVAAETAVFIMVCMSMGSGDSSLVWEDAATTSAANATGAVMVDWSVAVPNDICDRSLGGSMQG